MSVVALSLHFSIKYLHTQPIKRSPLIQDNNGVQDLCIRIHRTENLCRTLVSLFYLDFDTQPLDCTVNPVPTGTLATCACRALFRNETTGRLYDRRPRMLRKRNCTRNSSQNERSQLNSNV